jgi:transposase-like protein
VLHGLGIKGLVGVRLQAEKYDDDGAESYKCWIIVESSAIKKLSAELNEQVSDTVQDFVRENDFDNAMSEAGFDPDLFNWWPVRVENVGVATAAKNSPDPKKGNVAVAATSSSKKSYTEEFKKEVVHTALTAGTSLSEIARMYEINLTLVRNWKAKYEAEILKEINGAVANDSGSETNEVDTEDDIPTPTAIWHIDRAKFVFSDPAEYKKWKKDKKVFFEFSPSNSDDGGEAVFADAETAEDDFEVTEDRGLVKISLEKDGPVISAWVGVLAETVDDLDQDTLTDWSNDQSGWACSTIHLGEFEASIVEDDGGDWRMVEADKYWEADEVEGQYMEVIVTQSDDSEYIYWVNLESLPEGEDEYDWSIQVAVEHHNTLGLEQVSEDDVSASEPFSRNASEFTFLK